MSVCPLPSDSCRKMNLHSFTSFAFCKRWFSCSGYSARSCLSVAMLWHVARSVSCYFIKSVGYCGGDTRRSAVTQAALTASNFPCVRLMNCAAHEITADELRRYSISSTKAICMAQMRISSVYLMSKMLSHP